MTYRILSLSIGALICLCLSSCKSTQRGSMESKTIRWSKHHLTIGGRSDKNPVQESAENIEAGKQIFGYYCVVCHGRDGQNTGVPFAAGISPPIPSLASADVQSYSDGQLKWVITNGIFPSGMPASKGTLSDDDIWHIVVYLRHLPPVGSLGEPRAYTGNEFDSEPAAEKY
ncbi:MAG: cytochrome c class [Edaphobacter sp.]|nr:cytochrome c class [Edaphobacter sp.]